MTPRFVLNSSVVIALLITAFFATFVARIVQNRLQRYTKAYHAALVLSMEGVFSHLFVAAFLSESLSFIQYVGAALIVTSIAIVSLNALNSGS